MKQGCEGLNFQSDGHGLSEVKDRFSFIKQIYAIWLPIILKYGQRGIDPYFTNWDNMFTPIERQAWYSIRYYGIPLYPQLQTPSQKAPYFSEGMNG